MRRPNLIFGYATAIALVLAGCAVKIEPTDLSAVTVENDRIVIEKTLGKPDQVVEAQGFTVASYTYDKGYSEAPWLTLDKVVNAPGGHNYASTMLGLILGPILVPIAHASKTSKARARQKGRLAAIFDTDDKLLYAGSLEEPNPTSEKLTSMSARYREAQSGDAGALIGLSEITLIPGQKRTFIETAANSGSAEAQYRISSSVTEYAEKIGWLRRAAAQDHIGAQTDLGTLLLYGPDELVDRAEAKVWLTKAADAGNSKAQTELAKLSETETILARAERGHAASQVKVADSYRFGNEVPKNIGLAIRMYERAASAKDDYAAYALGNIYAGGEIGAIDLRRAYMWYSIAERLASEDKEELRRLKQEIAEDMTPAQIPEAGSLAREWLEAHPQ